jgi:hypothetical protein
MPPAYVAQPRGFPRQSQHISILFLQNLKSVSSPKRVRWVVLNIYVFLELFQKRVRCKVCWLDIVATTVMLWVKPKTKGKVERLDRRRLKNPTD